MLGILVAVGRLDEKMREVIPQGQAVIEGVDMGAQLPTVEAAGILRRQAGSLRFAAVRRIERAKAADKAFVDGSLRLVGGCIPRALGMDGREREALDFIAAAVPQNGIDLAQVIGVNPGAVIALQ